MQLYKLSDQHNRAVIELQTMLDSGDIDKESMSDTLEGIEGELTDKCINVGLHIKNLRSDLSQLDAVKKEFDAKMKSVKSQLEFYEGYLDANMQQSDIDSVTNEYIEIKYKKLPDVVDCEQAPDDYSIIVPETRKPDKNKIKAALKAGESLDFAKMVTGRTKLDIK